MPCGLLHQTRDEVLRGSEKPKSRTLTELIAPLCPEGLSPVTCAQPLRVDVGHLKSCLLLSPCFQRQREKRSISSGKLSSCLQHAQRLLSWWELPFCLMECGNSGGSSSGGFSFLTGCSRGALAPGSCHRFIEWYQEGAPEDNGDNRTMALSSERGD